jgi:phospholipase C
MTYNVNKTLSLVLLLATIPSILISSWLPSTAAALPLTKNYGSNTTTPIKHIVVIPQEDISFDHYFGTYPNAANPSG